MADAPIRFGVGVTDLTKLSRDLHSVSRDLSRGLTRDLKTAVEPVAVAARERASFSAKIAKTVHVTSTGGRAKVRVRVTAGGVRAPAAAAFEHLGQPGKFRHPVFGHKVWVGQDAHPFLFPALQEKAPEIADDVEKAIDGYLTSHGL